MNLILTEWIYGFKECWIHLLKQHKNKNEVDNTNKIFWTDWDRRDLGMIDNLLRYQKHSKLTYPLVKNISHLTLYYIYKVFRRIYTKGNATS